MAIEEGKKGKGENPSNQNQPDNTADLQKQVLELKATLEKLVKDGMPAAMPLPQNTDTHLLQQLLKEFRGTKAAEAIQGNQFVDEAHVDTADVMEEPAVFYSHKVGYLILGDKKNGIPVPSPRGKIFFEFSNVKVYGNAKDKDIINVSKFKTYSKKEAEFIRNHSYFNVYFHDDIEQAMNADTMRAHKLSLIIKRLEATDSHRLINIAREKGIKADANIEALRVLIAQSMVADEMAMEAAQNKKRAYDAVKEEKLFKTA